MVVAFLLSALGDLGCAGAARAWLHAFTVGALGSAMIGLMTRVALRHTGRPLALPGAIVAAHWLVHSDGHRARGLRWLILFSPKINRAW